MAAPTHEPDSGDKYLATEDEAPSLIRSLRFLGRALTLRCPWCGRGRPFRRWVLMRERCPSCGIQFEREEGYFLGAMALNLLISEFLAFGGTVVVLLLTWPNPPWLGLEVCVPIAAGLGPLLLFPFSRGLWLALDWTLHPPEVRRFREASRAA